MWLIDFFEFLTDKFGKLKMIRLPMKAIYAERSIINCLLARQGLTINYSRTTTGISINSCYIDGVETSLSSGFIEWYKALMECNYRVPCTIVINRNSRKVYLLGEN